jgi:hypothetical protein
MKRPVRVALLALGLALGGTLAPAGPLAGVAGAPEPATVAAAESWDGSVDLYRKGSFTTQKTWLWCTAAGVQIIRNLVRGEDDHSRSAQARYFDWMRGRNRYDLPESAGVDPAGWTAGLRHFVDDRYRLVASPSFEAGLRSAVTSLRRTGLPVALTVARGGHGWVLTGFSATADPLVTDDYAVRSVRVVGPLYGLQSRNGYDMPPNTSLSVAEFRRFFTSWRYAPKSMVWDGSYVSIQPSGEAAPAATRVTATLPEPRGPWTFGDPVAGPRAPVSGLSRWAGHR